MKIVKPSVDILTPPNGEAILRHIEQCGRVCYKSEARITEDSAAKFIQNLLQKGISKNSKNFLRGKRKF